MAQDASHIILFSDYDLKGDHKHVVADEPNLAATEDASFNDRTCSFVILSGHWVFFQDIEYQTPYPGVFGPGIYTHPDWLGVPANALSSLRPVTDPYTLLGDATAGMVTLFEHAYFHGDHRHLFLPTLDFTDPGVNFNDVVSSLVIQGTSPARPSITLYSDINQGRPYPQNLSTGLFAFVGDYGFPNDDLSSVWIAGHQPGAPADLNGDEAFGEIILFEHEQFRGAHKHVYQAEPDLGAADDSSFLNLASSFRIFSGAWAFFAQPGFQQIMPNWNIASFPLDLETASWNEAESGQTWAPDAPALFLPGAYPTLAGTGVANDAIRSLKMATTDLYFITWDPTGDPQAVWVVLLVGRHAAFGAELDLNGAAQWIDGAAYPPNFAEWHTYTDASGTAWAHAYYWSTYLPQGITAHFSLSSGIQGDWGTSTTRASADWLTSKPNVPVSTVPTLIGHNGNDAFNELQAANLVPEPINLSYPVVIDNARLFVVAQDTAPGTTVPQGTQIGYSLNVHAGTPPSGYGSVHCHNINNDQLPVTLWLWNGAGWSSQGSLNYGQAKDVSLPDKATALLAAYANGRSPNDPTDNVADAQTTPLPGAKGGPAYDFEITF